jgi:hypothetical protein
MVSATPGRIVLEMETNASGRIVKRGKLKVWTGVVPSTPIEEAIEQSRNRAVQIVTRNPSHFQHMAPDIEMLTP